ncbi:MAG: TldE/PmbA family protein [Betaproteobacteria bacterium]|nr:TldE/PmbA family protein [Betaproteobacteria bacterium]
MKSQFFELADALVRECRSGETLLCSLSAERSDFVRFNKALVRQAGTVEQRYLTLRLIRERRQASATIALAGNTDDLAFARATLERVREMLVHLPEDPWLLVAETPASTTTERRGRIPAAEEVMQQVVRDAKGLDFAGFYAAGAVYRGFANSYGQRNWHEVDTFNLDWSLHLRADKAVKEGYAGFDWDATVFKAKMERAAQQLELLDRPPVALEPGEYRAYLSPHALEEITGLLSWGAFSARSRATRQSALLRMEHGERLSSKVTLAENTEGGIAPLFQQDGFVRPPRVTLIDKGALGESLVSPRSAREYALQANGANSAESPESLDLAAGELDASDALEALDSGLYIGNLWYLNYSDRPAGRITGMTRFATFRVAGGRITAPVNPLRFDDTIYRVLGENLVDLTRERELLLSTSTYDERSTSSSHLPGALLSSLRFTL